MNRFRRIILAVTFAVAAALPLPAQEPQHPGEAIYVKQCASCHGKQGEGVADEYDEPLVGGRTLAALTRRVKRTMPEEDPGSLTDEQAAQVSSYIYDAFYSAAAQARLRPPEIDVARLTVPQYRNSVADLIGRFRGGFQKPSGEEKGLRGRYSGFAFERLGPPAPLPPGAKKEDKEKQRDRESFDLVDAQVAFSFGADSPKPGWMIPEEFRVRWEGSIFAPETGTYEFAIKTENGVRLWLNDNKTLLIDGWVTPGEQVREEKKSIFLLGGRHYPVVLEFFKYKDKSASVAFEWKKPHGVLEPVPARVLSPKQVRPTMVVSTSFPPDDRSVGYERGTGVSKAWYQAITASAISVAEYVEANLAELADVKANAADRVEKLKNFSQRFMETAFRRPLTDAQKALVEAQFGSAKAPEVAVKRVVLLALGSPQFLYPGIDDPEVPDDYAVAARLALTMWDSLPDDRLRSVAAAGKLRKPNEIADEAKRMIADQRTREKLDGFFHHWLELERAESIAKDSKMFPGFDERVLADLRTSLSLFLEHVVWSERSDYRELLLADYVFMNGRLARFYGKGDGNEEFRRVSFGEKERAGVVTHPFMMATLAYNKQTSPIHRGVFLTRNVLGLTLKSPAMAIEFEDSHFDPTLTMREKVTQLTKDRSCIGCHAVINPLGFALEHFDAIGRWRTVDNKKPVDPVGEVHTDDAQTIRLAGARDVADFAASSESGQRAFIRHLFRNTVKQEAGAFGTDTMDSLHRSFAANQFNIQKLLGEIAVVTASRGLPAPESQKIAKK